MDLSVLKHEVKVDGGKLRSTKDEVRAGGMTRYVLRIKDGLTSFIQFLHRIQLFQTWKKLQSTKSEERRE